ncbi:hypothetical protein [Pedobacter aquatilis]|uniref:hypothetical protein n=1 Tax=Pedobacter aquatilis TaxID=351343 RepID=UPI0029309FB0|nr:hypothetical protein [Pedobacter aquatilis]
MRKTIGNILLLSTLLGCGIDDQATYRTTEVKSNTVEEILFIKTMNWGLTGDSQTTIISTTDKVDFNKKESDEYFIFNGLQPFFYRQSNDSLLLYSQTVVHVPKNMKTKWKIIQNVVDNPTLMDFHHDKKYTKP